MQEEEELPPFWLQTTTTSLRRGRRHRSNPFSSSIFLNSGLLLIALVVIAFVLIFIVVPSLTSFTSQIFRPHSIKKGWDSLNLVLVLFAIVCGFLSRNNNNNDNNSQSAGFYADQSLSGLRQDSQKSHPSTPRTWYDQDRTTYNSLSRLRSFSSYPDLRQESNWITDEERWRFYDDTHLHSYRASSSYQINHADPPPEKEEESSKNEEAVQEGVDTKDIHVVTSVISHQKEVTSKQQPENPSPPHRPPSPPPTKPSSPPQPPLSGATSKVVRRKVKRTYHDLGHHEKRSEDRNLEVVKDIYIPPPSPPPPPPPFNENEKRRGKDSFLVSLRRKKKKQRQKSVENLASLFDHPQTSNTSITPSPPPPPPPPPPHFFQNIFSPKRGKTKKIHSVPPPPPPPPPSFTIGQPLQFRASKAKSQVAQVTSNKPPKPVKTNTTLEENVDSGNASPSIPIPPPPPPPPFKMPPWRFVVDGDYIRVGSFNSSRSGSPDSENLEDPSDKESSDSPMADGGGTAALFCPSPDVNTKADNFIARFRAGLRLEKVNSVKGRSNLGIEPSSVNEGEGRS